MRMMVARVLRRPILSPMLPKTSAPMGRITNATPKTAKVAMRETRRLSAGKKSGAITTAR